MDSPLKTSGTEAVVDLTADDGDVVFTGISISPSKRKTPAADALPEKQRLDPLQQRSKQRMSAGPPATFPSAAAGASASTQPAGSLSSEAARRRSTSPSKQQLPPSQPSLIAPTLPGEQPVAAASSSKHSSQQPTNHNLTTPALLGSSSSDSSVTEVEPRRSSRSSSARRVSAPSATPATVASHSTQPDASSSKQAQGMMEGSIKFDTRSALEPPSSTRTFDATGTSAAHTPSPGRAPPPATAYFADLSPAPSDVKPVITFVPPADPRPLRITKDEAGQEVIDLEDTDDEDDESEEDSEDEEMEESGGEHLGPSDGEGLHTEDDGRASGDDSGAEGDNDDDEEGEEGETDADASAMEIDNHLMLDEGARPKPGSLEAKLDAHHSATTSPQPKVPVGTPQRNASAGPSGTQMHDVPGFHSGSSDFTSPTSSVALQANADGSTSTGVQPAQKVKIKRPPRPESPPLPERPVKPNITLRLQHPVQIGKFTDFSLYEKALEMGQYDDATVEHFSQARIIKTIQAQREKEAREGSKKRKRVKVPDGATPEEVLARNLEAKYGAKRKRRNINREDDYDLNDGFVDDSTADVDQPEYAAIPEEEGFYVHVGTLKLRGEDDEPESQYAKKPPKGSIDSSSDAKPKSLQLKRRQTNLSHLVQSELVQTTVVGGEDSEMRDVSTTVTTNLVALPLLDPPHGLNGASSSTYAVSRDVKPAALQPSTSAPSPIVLSSTSAEITTVKTAETTATSSSSAPKPKPVRTQPEAAVPEQLIPIIKELQEKIDAHDWSNKKVFPEHLRPIISRLVEAAIAVDWYSADFFNLMPKIFPYNRFTMHKLIRRQMFKFHEELLQKQRARLIREFQVEVDKEKAVQVPKYEAALKEWEEKQKEKAAHPVAAAPVQTPGSTIVMSPGSVAAGVGPAPAAFNGIVTASGVAPHSPERSLAQLPFPNGPSTPVSKPTAEDKPPKKMMRLSKTMRDLLWTLFGLTDEIWELTKEVNAWEGKPEPKIMKARKTLYSDLTACFPNGFMHTTDLSRLVSAQKQKERKEQETIDE